MGKKLSKKSTEEKTTRIEKKSEVAFFRSIRFRLILSFLIPVVCIIVLGAASYKKASGALVSNYQASVSQTMDMMQQYVSLIVQSEKDTFKSYLNDEDMKKYIGGLFSEEDEKSKGFAFQKEITGKMAMDSKIKSVYFLLDAGKSISVGSENIALDAYTEYTATSQGQYVLDNASAWHIFGQNEQSDLPLNADTNGYALRIAKKMNESKAIMVVNLDASFVRSAMQSMDPGSNGYVVLITSDGREFYSDDTIQLGAPMVYGTDFYNQALEAEDSEGESIIRLNGKPYLFVYSKLSSGNAMVATLIPQARLLAASSDIQRLTLILTIAAALIAMILGTLISRSMSGTIEYILRQLRKVSKGDLTVHLTSKSKDEFGLLCQGVNETVEHVKDLIINVNEVSGKLNEAATYVNDASGTFVETSNDIQNVVSELEIGVNKLDSGSEDCLSQMDSLSGKISNVSTNAEEIGKLTTSAGNTITVGIASVQELTASAKSTTEITQNVIVAIEELEDKSKSIHKIIQDINDIAEQTNLLSLNASIEAARAGEAGKGFAVVAEEIRKLSDQCQESAGKIANIVTEIIEKTQEVVDIAKQAEDVVASQSGAVEDTTNSFRMIDDQVASLIEALKTISSNVEEMSTSRNETLEAIESISAVSAETAACSSSVHETAGTQLNAVKDLEDASAELRNRSDRLVEILGTFQV